MNPFIISKSNQDTVVFHMWKSLKYKKRMALSLGFIVIGIALQLYTLNYLSGIWAIVLGVLLVLTKGYDNRLKSVSFNANVDWSKVSREQVQNIIDINKKLIKWDKSNVDVSNASGGVLFFTVVAVLIMMLALNPLNDLPLTIILVVDAALLILPHWLTGIKQITTTPALIKKVQYFFNVLKVCDSELTNNDIEYNLLLKGDESKLPKDIKVKVGFENQPDDFLGLYAQLNMNNVNGGIFPYFYVVMVAKKSFDLLKWFYDIEGMKNVDVEKQEGDDVDVIIIRQHTTKKSGYDTPPSTMARILKHGIAQTEKILKG